MNRWFFRIFLGVLLAVAGSHALSTGLLWRRLGADREVFVRARAERDAAMIVDALATVPPAGREEALRRLGVEADLVPPGVRPPPGPVVALLPDGTGVVVHPFGPRPPGPGVLAVQLLAVLGLTALVGWRLAAPVARDLAALERAVERFGRGELAVRVGLEGGPVGGLAAGFDRMAERVAGLVEGQRQLFQAVSHEIRTPAARIRFAAASVDAPSIDDDLDEIDALLDELLTYLRLDVDRGSAMRDAPLDPTLEDAVASVAPLSELPVEVVGATGLVARVERRWLRRAVENLLTNAVRHAKTRVRVTVASDGAWVRVDVDDDGPGVREADRERIFAPFATGDAARGRLGGVGLGLAIVARIVAREGGTVTVGDSDLGGARFSTRWPAK